MPNLRSHFTSLIFSLFFILFANIFSSLSYALPIDWKGTFGVDSTLIDTYRRMDDLFIGTNNGSQIPDYNAGNYKNATFQSYIFSLKPSIIVNDSASFHSEFTSGYNRGGFLGDDLAPRKEATADKAWGNALYLHNTSDGDADLNISQLYMELFTDTATLLIGRHSVHWGLGSIWNKGDDLWSRYATTRDGLTAKFKIGNFNFSPYYAKINSQGGLNKASNTKEYGLELLYDNIQNELTFGVLFSKRKSGAANTFYSSNISTAPLGRANVKITDFYLKKSLGKFIFSAEVPFASGDLGSVYSANQNTKYKAQGIITESKFVLNDNWHFGLNAGMTSGDDGKGDSFEALYLNPNYQIANLMFRYNLFAIENSNQSIYDSYIVNAKFLKLFAQYTVDSWSWNLAIIHAIANEVAEGNSAIAFNHAKNKTFVSDYKQKDDLGTEVDFGMKYFWNPNVIINTDFGYHFVGDYFAYSNTKNVKTKNSFAMTAGVALTF